MVQDRDIVKRKTINKSCMMHRNARLSVTVSAAIKATFAVLNLCNSNTHNSGNTACFNYSVFRYKLESARSL